MHHQLRMWIILNDGAFESGGKRKKKYQLQLYEVCFHRFFHGRSRMLGYY